MENLFIIYRASHPSQGTYIGMTRSGLSSRRGSHVSAAKRGSMLPFHKALRARPCGWSWSILGTSMDHDEAGRMEAAAIQQYDATLNIREGGVGGGKYPPGYGDAQRQRMTGKRMSAEFKEWVTEFHRTRPRKRLYDREEVRALAASGLTQTAIAARLGCNQSVVSNILSGKSRP